MEMQQNPLDCLRCNLPIKHPVRPPCQHHFCQKCTIGMDRCHVCERAINAADLCEDKVLSYVLESSQEATETCANCDKISQPMYFCETCQQPLCSECRETTHKAKIFFLHHIVQLEERGRVRNRPFCSTHNEPFILFCLDSKSLMCIECFNSSSLERRGHFVNIDVAHKICRDKLEKSGANLRVFHQELREQIELRRRLIFELQKNSEKLTAEIEQKCEETCNRVMALKSRLLKKVAEDRAEREQQINAQLGQILHLESPVSVNLLSISIFCSYASKIDMLHCYADLYKAIQQFLSANGQHVQKVKFDCAMSVDFPAEFYQMVCQPLGFHQHPSGATGNVFLDCHPSATTVGTAVSHHHHHSIERSAANSRKGSSERGNVPTGVVAIQEVSPNNFEPIVEYGTGSDIVAMPTDALLSPPTFILNDPIMPFTSSFPVANYESDNDQRFMEHFQQITNPLRRFAEEIALIAKNLMCLQKDITLRRCVVTGEELMNRIASCEDAWSRLEQHNRLVHKILNLFMGQHWRKEIERVQRQQQAVRDKVEEMKQLQELAQTALKISQQLKPFATQMANLISMIDVRRCSPIAPPITPMEQICLEITQIEPDSESRVAAIEKKEESRRLAKLDAERAQFEQKEAVQARKNLKAQKTAQKQQHRTSLVLEMDRDRTSTINGNGENGGAPYSCVSSPLTAKKRQQLQSRVHRNSESAISDSSATSPSFKLFASGELATSLEEAAEEKTTPQTKPMATVAPTPPPREMPPTLREEEGSKEGERSRMEDGTSNELARPPTNNISNQGGTQPFVVEAAAEPEQPAMAPANQAKQTPPTVTVPSPPPPPPIPVPTLTLPPIASPADRPSTSAGGGTSIIRQQTQDKDPALLLVREKLLESIREKVKKIDAIDD